MVTQSQLDALKALQTYADNPTLVNAPTASTYSKLGLGLKDRNGNPLNFSALLPSLNSALATARVDSQKIASLEDVANLVTSYVLILDYATSGTNPVPSAEDYARIGIEMGLSAQTHGLKLLNSVVDSKSRSEVNTAPKLQALASAADTVLAVVAGERPYAELTIDMLDALGVGGVTDKNVMVIRRVLANQNDDGSDTASLDALQDLVNSATDAQAAVEAYANAKTEVLPTQSTYRDMGLILSEKQVSLVNSALQTELVTGKGGDTPAELDRIIAILDGIVDMAGNAARTDVISKADFATIGIAVDDVSYTIGSKTVSSNISVLASQAFQSKADLDFTTVQEMEGWVNVLEGLMQLVSGQTNATTSRLKKEELQKYDLLPSKIEDDTAKVLSALVNGNKEKGTPGIVGREINQLSDLKEAILDCFGPVVTISPLHDPDNASFDIGFEVRFGAELSVSINGVVQSFDQLYAKFNIGPHGNKIRYEAKPGVFKGDEVIVVNATYTDQNDITGYAVETRLQSVDTTAPNLPNARLTTDSSDGRAGGDKDAYTNVGNITAPTNIPSGGSVDYRVTKDGVTGAWSPTYKAPATDGSADGLYSVEVRIKDAAGNSKTQTLGFTLDTTPPVIEVKELAHPTAPGKAMGFSINAGATLEAVSLNGKVLSSTELANSFSKITSGGLDLYLAKNTLQTGGSNILSVSASVKDKAGNVGTGTFNGTQDLISAGVSVIAINDADANDPTAYDQGFSVEAGATVSVKIDGKLLSDVEDYFSLAREGDRDVYTAVASKFVGTEKVDVTATRVVSGTTYSAGVALNKIDTTSPALTAANKIASDDIIGLPEAETGFVVSGTTAAQVGQLVSVKLSGSASAEKTAKVIAGANGVNTWRAVLTEADLPVDDNGNIIQGTAQLDVSVRDAAGNRSSTQLAVMVDTVANAPVLSPPAKLLRSNLPGGELSLSGSASEGGQVLLQWRDLSGKVLVDKSISVASNIGGSWKLNLAAADIPVGTGTLSASFKDSQGNISETRNFKIDAYERIGSAPVQISANEDSATTAVASLELTTRAYTKNGETRAAAKGLSYTIETIPSFMTLFKADGTTPVKQGDVLTQEELQGLKYKTLENANGAQAITWSIQDSTGESFKDSLSVTVNAVNDRPVRIGDLPLFTAVNEDGANAAAKSLGLDKVDYGNGGGSDEAAQTRTYTIETIPSFIQLFKADGTTAVKGGDSLTLAELRNLTYKTVANANGSADLTWLVKDSGGTANGGEDTYREFFRATVNNVNDAPVASGSATLAAIAEDTAQATIAGNTVRNLFAGNFNDNADAVSGGSSAASLAGIAISSHSVDSTKGAWQYSTDAGKTWLALGAATTTSAITLKAEDLLRFVPKANYNGAATALSAHLIESGGSAITSGGTVTLGSTGTGGATVYSSATVALNHSISAVNDAPLASGSATLAAIAEDTAQATIAGNTVRNLFAGNFNDNADAVSGGSSAASLAGIAISSHSVDSTKGAWQYSTNGGQTWVSLGAATTASAITLKAEDLLRFVPKANYNGAATALSAHLIESGGSAITSGGTVTLGSTGTGGATVYSSATVALNHSISAVNDAPLASGSATLAAIAEDTAQATIAGNTVRNLFAGNFNDNADAVSGGSSAASLAGIAISSHSVDSTKGAWQYSTDAGKTWLALGAATTTSAIILKAEDLLRFVPTANYNGAATALSAHLIESGGSTITSAGTVNLSTAGSTGGATVYSSTAVALNHSITAVNDAPLASGSATLAAINEDATAPAGSKVSALFGANFNDNADAVSGGSSAASLAGIAISSHSVDSTKGAWQYSSNGGQTWVSLGAATTASAITLKAEDMLRFVPKANYNGAATALSAHLIEAGGSAITSAGSVNLSTAGSTGGATVYSSATVALSHSISAVNDAPVASGSATLAAINEDTAQATIAGNTIRNLFAGNFNDNADAVSGGSSAATLAGIAISSHSVDSTKGAWQYSTDAGKTWLALGAATTTSAITLKADDLLRFVPTANHNGAVTALSAHLIESGGSAITSGGTVTLGSTGTGGATVYSSTTVALSHSITAVNDAPLASGSATLAAINEDATAPAGSKVSALFGANFSDSADAVTGGSSAASLAGIAISAHTQDAAKGAWQYSSNGGQTWAPLGAATTASAITLKADDLLRFVPTANYNGAATALSAYLIESGGSAITSGGTVTLGSTGTGGATVYSSATVALSHSITAVNDRPVLTGTLPTFTAVNEDSVNTAKSLGLEKVDYGNGGGSDEAAQTRTYTIETIPSFIQLFKADGVTAVKGGDSLTLAELRNLTYKTVANANGSGNITWSVKDSGAVANGGDDTLPQSLSVTVNAVNDAPINTVPAAPVAFEGSGSIGLKDLAVDNAGDLNSQGQPEAMTLTLQVNSGSLTVDIQKASGFGLTLKDNGTGTVTLSGHQDSLNKLLASVDSVRFTPGADYNARAAIVTMTSTDGVSTDVDHFLIAKSAHKAGPGPFVLNVAITGATGMTGKLLDQGDVLSTTVTFNDTVTVTGKPQLALNIGGQIVQATYASGSGSKQLVFSYTIEDNQADTNGISINADSLSLNGGAIKGAASTLDAYLAHGAVADNPNYLVQDITQPEQALTLVITDDVGPVKGTVAAGTATDDNLLTLGGNFGGATEGAQLKAGEKLQILAVPKWDGIQTVSFNNELGRNPQLPDGTAGVDRLILRVADGNYSETYQLPKNPTVGDMVLVDKTSLYPTTLLAGNTTVAKLTGNTLRGFKWDGQAWIGEDEKEDMQTVSFKNGLNNSPQLPDGTANVDRLLVRVADGDYSETYQLPKNPTVGDVVLIDKISTLDTKLLAGNTTVAALSGTTSRSFKWDGQAWVDARTVIGEATVKVNPAGQSTWSFNSTTAMPDGWAVLGARVIDQAGNVGKDLTQMVYVNAINDAPSRKGALPTVPAVNEDSANTTPASLGLSALDYSAGRLGEEAQALSYTLETIPGFITLFKADGTTEVKAKTVLTLAELRGLTYKTVADANGTGEITWSVKDNGGIANGGKDTLSQSLSVTVTAVNDAPVRIGALPAFTAANEDSANGTAISLGLDELDYGNGGGSDEAGQTRTYTIETIPSFLTLFKADGTTAVKAGATLSLTELRGLKYKTMANANGEGTITWSVKDSGGVANGGQDTYLESFKVTVNAVNDVPARIGDLPTFTAVAEDSANTTAISLGLDKLDYGNGGGSDEAGQSRSYTIATIPGFMALFKADGTTAVTAGATLSLAELRGLKYKTVANANGEGTITWSVKDSGGTANGGQDTYLESFKVSVNAINDAPTASGSATLTAINEDTSAPAGQKVSALFGANFSDSADAVTGGSSASTLAGIAISSHSADSNKGAWQYSSNGGQTWATLGAATAASAITLKAEDLLRFVPKAHYNGPATALSAHLIEAGGSTITSAGSVNLSTPGATGGSTVYSSTSVALSHSITAVNDAPVRIGDLPVFAAVNEDSANAAAVTLGLDKLDYGNGGGSDETGQSRSYTIETIPGFLTLFKADGTTAVKAGASLTLTELRGLKYKSVANANGSGEITWSVKDSGGVANGGQDTYLESFKVTVNAVNDAPARIGDLPVFAAVNEDSANTTAISLGLDKLDYGNGGGSDEAGQSRSYTIATIPSFIALFKADGTTAVTAGATLSLAELRGLKYKTVANANANGSGEITWSVKDSGGITNGGQDTYLESFKVTVNAVSDAPVINGNATLAAINEDATTLAGETIRTIFGPSFNDSADAFTGGSSASTLGGIAITAHNRDNSKGYWQYSLDAGKTWVDLGVANVFSIVTFKADDLLRFVPKANYNGTATQLGAYLLESGASISSGAYIGGLSQLNTSIGGSHLRTSSVVQLVHSITAVNDAPVASGSATLAAIAEDTAKATIAGATVASIFETSFKDATDSVSGGSSAGSLGGIAISAHIQVAAKGSWEYSVDQGANWLSLGNASLSNALTFKATDMLRFVPAADYNGAATDLSAYLIESSSSVIQSNSGIDLSKVSKGGSTFYSSDAVSLSHSITAVNDAPGVNGYNTTLEPISEDTVTPAGDRVDNLFKAFFNDDRDGNASALAGIAISSHKINASRGVWQYSTDSGRSWKALEDTSVSNAFTLQPSDMLRFVPAANYSGDATPLGASLIESGGQAITSGGSVNLSAANGGRGKSTVYSAGEVFLQQKITAVNDKPVRTGTLDAFTAVNEDSANATALSLKLDKLDYGKGGGADEVNQTLSYTIDAIPTFITLWKVDGTARVLPGASLTLAELRGLKYKTVADANGTGNITWTVKDSAGESFEERLSVTVKAVNDAPVASGSATLAAIAEDTAQATIAGNTVRNLFAGNFSDNADAFSGGSTANTLAGIAISSHTADTSKGAWQYSADAGKTWKDLGNVTTTGTGATATTSAITLKAEDLLRFVPKANYNGAATALSAYLIESGGPAITSGSTVTLGSTGTGGATAYSSTTVALNHSITAVNDAPVAMGTMGTSITVSEDLKNILLDSLGLSSLNYGPGGGADEASQTLSYQINTIPDFITLWKVDGKTQVVKDQSLSLDELRGLRFKTVPDANGQGNITWTVKDSGGIANGGIAELKQSLLMNVNAVNDAPVRTGTVPAVIGSVPEDRYNDIAASLPLADAAYSPGGGADEAAQTLSYQITAIPGFITLWKADGKTQVVKDQSLSLDELRGLMAKTVPNANGVGNITWTVKDSGGAILQESSSISVTAVNDAPVASGSATLAAIAEDASAPAGNTVRNLFVANFDDSKDGASASALAGIAISSHTADTSKGAWQYSSDAGKTWSNLGNVTTTGIGATATTSAITLKAEDLLRFVPKANYNGAATALSAYLIESGGSAITSGGTVTLGSTGTGGATVYSSATVALSHSITAVNDRPVLTGTLPTFTAVNEDSVNTAKSLGLEKVDYGNGGGSDEAAQTRTYTIETIPSFIQLFKADGVTAVKGGDSLTLAELRNLTYKTVANANGSGNITWSVKDSGAVANGGDDTLPQSLSVTVNAVNDAPINTVPAAPVAFEGSGSIGLKDLAVDNAGDLNSQGQPEAMTLTLQVNSGSLTVDIQKASGFGLTLKDNGTGTVTLSGHQDSLNKLLASVDSVRFTPGADYNARAAIVTMTSTDGVSTDVDHFLIAKSAHKAGPGPFVLNVAITGATGMTGKLLDQGDVLSTTVTFNDTVTVTGKPQLALNIGGQIVQATYASGSGSKQLVFSYTIEDNQADTNGISINADSLSLNGGAIKGAASTLDAYLAHGAVADNPNYLVQDITQPEQALTLVITDDVGPVKGTVAAGTATDDNLLTLGGNFGGATEGAQLKAGEKLQILATLNWDATQTVSFNNELGRNPQLPDGTAGVDRLILRVADGNYSETYQLPKTPTVGDVVLVDKTSMYPTTLLAGNTTVAKLTGNTLRGFKWDGQAWIDEDAGDDTRTVSFKNGLNNSPQLPDGTAHVDRLLVRVADGDYSETYQLPKNPTVGDVVLIDKISTLDTKLLAGNTTVAALSGTTSRSFKWDGTAWVDARTVIGEATVKVNPAGQSTWSFNSTAAMPDGWTVLGARVIDQAGNVGKDFTQMVYVNAINDAPSRKGAMPTVPAVNEDSANTKAVSLGLSALDYSAGRLGEEAQALSYTLETIPGFITLFKADGTTEVKAKTVLTLAELRGLTYKTVADANGSGEITWSVKDNGGIANGGVDSFTDRLSVTVNAVNDAPVATGTRLPGIILDEDAFPNGLELGLNKVTYSPGGGDDEAKQALNYTLNAFPSFMTLWTADRKTQVKEGDSLTLAELQGLYGKPNANANGSGYIRWTVTDSQGAFLQEDFSFTINPVNDAPINTIPAAPLAFEGSGSIGLKGLAVDNADDLNSQGQPEAMTLTLQVNSGSLTVDIQKASGFGLTLKDNGSSTVTLSGHQDSLNKLLASVDSVRFTPGADYNARAAIVTMTSSDGVSTDVDYFLIAKSAHKAGSGPFVLNVAITGATGMTGKLLDQGDVLSTTVTFNDTVTVTGKPQLALNIGGQIVQATYASGSGSKQLVFRYTIEDNQADTNGISINADSLSLNGGAIKGAASTLDAYLAHGAVADNPGYLVQDITQPEQALTLVITDDVGPVKGTVAAGTATDDNLLTLGGNFGGATEGAQLKAGEKLQILAVPKWDGIQTVSFNNELGRNPQLPDGTAGIDRLILRVADGNWNDIYQLPKNPTVGDVVFVDKTSLYNTTLLADNTTVAKLTGNTLRGFKWDGKAWVDEDAGDDTRTVSFKNGLNNSPQLPDGTAHVDRLLVRVADGDYSETYQLPKNPTVGDVVLIDKISTLDTKLLAGNTTVAALSGTTSRSFKWDGTAWVDARTVIGEATVKVNPAGQSTWSFNSTTAMPDGWAVLGARVIDQAGNVGKDLTQMVYVNAINDAPSRKGALPTLAAVNEDYANTTPVSLGLSALDYSAGRLGEEAQALSYTLETIPGFITLWKTADSTKTQVKVLANENLSLNELRSLSYTTEPNANGSGEITWSVKDNGGTANGGKDTLTQSLSITVNAVNDAPVASGSATLAAINEDAAAPASDTVKNLFSVNFDDSADSSKASSLAGIAISSHTVDADKGKWQYSMDAGKTWTDLAGASMSAALSFKTDDRLRFVPKAHYNGPATALSAHLIESGGSAITSAGFVNLSNAGATGGSTVYSSAAVALSHSITAVNDAPVRIGDLPVFAAVNEDSANATALSLGLSKLDYGNGGGSDEAGQIRSYTIESVPSFIKLFKGDGTNEVTAKTALTLAELQGLKYKTVANANGSGNITWTVKDNGGTANGGVDTLPQSLSVTVNAVNDKPSSHFSVSWDPRVGGKFVLNDSTTDADGIKTKNYAFARSTGGENWTYIAKDRIVGNYFELSAAEMGCFIRSVVWYVDGDGNHELFYNQMAGMKLQPNGNWVGYQMNGVYVPLTSPPDFPYEAPKKLSMSDARQLVELSDQPQQIDSSEVNSQVADPLLTELSTSSVEPQPISGVTDGLSADIGKDMAPVLIQGEIFRAPLPQPETNQVFIFDEHHVVNQPPGDWGNTGVTDTLRDFQPWNPTTGVGDKLDIGQLLEGYTPGMSDLSKWVSLATGQTIGSVPNSSRLTVDIDGAGPDTVTYVIELQGTNLAGSSLNKLVTDGVILA